MRRLPLLPLCLLAVTAPGAAAPAAAPDRAQILATMRRATAFMVEKVSCHGGYVWSYLPDLSRRWGEMEATPTMIWMQAGTSDMGGVFLDAYRATGDELFYDAAARAGDALLQAQHPAGGWNYVHDFAGDESLRRWYATVGRNGWRLEEFQHYYGNATFDDNTTADAARFLLRLYLVKREPRFKAGLDRAIGFVLAAQQPCGGWPQRFPPTSGYERDGHPDYSGFITLNDDVAAGNIEFLLLCYQALGEPRLLEPIRRAMDAFVVLQQPAPQAGWALQYTPDLQPAGARTYEPRALATHGTAGCIGQMLRFYSLTGDRKFLARLPEAFDWLDAVKLPPGLAGARGSHPTFVEVGTNRPLFLHRRGSNAINGRYWADGDPAHTIGHYSSVRQVDTARLRERYQQALAADSAALAAKSPLRPDARPVDPATLTWSRGEENPFWAARFGGGTPAERAARAVANLNADGYWPAPLRSTTHPYHGDGPAEAAPGDFGGTDVGDDYDTSPYPAPAPVMGISTRTFMMNLRALIGALEGKP